MEPSVLLFYLDMNKYTQKTGLSTSRKIRDLGHSSALTAVALQDQLVRDLSLNLNNPLNRPFNVRKSNPKPRLQQAVVDTRRGKPKKKDTAQAQEYVLDAKPVKLTLAQKLGLIAAPEQPLSENDWQKVKETSNKRDDFKQPCVICKEDFGVKEQALLSCTHVFHKACIQAFERFTGKKSCPMCRKEQYQTRIVCEGATYYKHKCATKIQALWRGYIVRSWYLKLRQTLPPNNPVLRKKFFEQKLQDITERMLRSVDIDVDGFLRELDDSLEASRDVFRRFDDVTRIISDEEWENIQLKALQRDISDCPICLTSLTSSGLITDAMATASLPDKQTSKVSKNRSQNAKNEQGRTRKSSVSSSAATKNTSKIHQKNEKCSTSQTVIRASGQNSIYSDPATECQNPFERYTCVSSTSKPTKIRALKSQVILSCSHVFHKTCLEAFEELAADSRRFVCPVCRSHYQKQVIILDAVD